MRKLSHAASLCLLFISIAHAVDNDPLTSGFRDPPNSAKPHTWWHWMNGNITREGITADMEAMKRVGIGGAQIFSVYCSIPPGQVEFMSREYRQMITHAAQEADRLGIELGLQNCAGWSNSGGPWNTPSHAMQFVVTSEMNIKGPRRFSDTLPQPQTNLDFYRDIAILAFPTPALEAVQMKSQHVVIGGSVPGIDGTKLIDGDIDSAVMLPRPGPDHSPFVQVEFDQPAEVRSVTLVPGKGMSECGGVIQASDDGKDFRDIGAFGFPRMAAAWSFSGIPMAAARPIVLSPESQPIRARFYRVLFDRAGADMKQIPLAEIDFSPRPLIGNLGMKAGYQPGAVDTQSDEVSSEHAIPRDAVVDLTSKFSLEGRLTWEVPDGQWTILRVGHTPTGRNNHPAPKQGIGLECDKLSSEALDAHWAGMMQKLLDDVGPLAGKTINNALIDSYEVGGQNWTQRMRAEFQSRRGYDPAPLLPVMTGRLVGNREISERFLWDLRRTIADLFAENYYGHFAELCHQNELVAAIEPYAGPFESLQCGAAADIVMGEFWTDRIPDPSVKLAASVAHIYGKRIVGAEAFTSRPPDHGRWLEDPYSLKALGDLMYCQGINRFILHRYAHQPWLDRAPGMTMGRWGFHFDRTNTWFEQSAPWLKYLARCQYLLQQGRFVADAAYFSGEGAPAETKLGEPSLPAGYDCDAINADVLLKRASVKDGRIVLPDGMSYAVLILPPSETLMTPALLGKLRQLVADGATIIGPKPKRSPSLTDYPKCDEQVSALASELWGDCDGKSVTEHSFGKGRVIWGKTLADVFAAVSLAPDFEPPASVTPDLAYIHRIVDDIDIYFVSNQRESFEQVECIFRVAGKVPSLWHPDIGTIEPTAWRETQGRTAVSLQFDPRGSVFVVFRKDNANQMHGMTVPVQAVQKKDLWEVVGPWELYFPPKWGAPEKVKLDNLISWTAHGDPGVKYFSGTATYIKTMKIPPEMLLANRSVFLDLGKVKNLAAVKCNGKDLGILWKPPFRADLTGAAIAGDNTIEIRVTNLWPNRLIGDEQLPDDCEWNGNQLARWPQWLLDGKPSPNGRVTFTTWHHWTKEAEPIESGLLGPVTVESVERVR